MQCVSRRLLCVLVAWLFCDRGAALVTARKVSTPPSPKGQQPASRRTGHSVPASRAPMQKGVPDLWSYPLSDSVDRVGSGLSIHARASPELEPSKTTSPRVYKSPWSSSHRGQPAVVSTKAPGTRAIEDNRPSCLQKFLDPESSRATGPRVCNRSASL